MKYTIQVFDIIVILFKVIGIFITDRKNLRAELSSISL